MPGSEDKAMKALAPTVTREKNKRSLINYKYICAALLSHFLCNCWPQDTRLEVPAAEQVQC